MARSARVGQVLVRSELGRGGLISNTQWPPSSPNCNHMDYFFWDAIHELVMYSGRKEPFNDVDELKRAIRRCWRNAQDIHKIRRAIAQFLPRLREVVKNNGGPINTHIWIDTVYFLLPDNSIVYVNRVFTLEWHSCNVLITFFFLNISVCLDFTFLLFFAPITVE